MNISEISLLLPIQETSSLPKMDLKGKTLFPELDAKIGSVFHASGIEASKQTPNEDESFLMELEGLLLQDPKTLDLSVRDITDRKLILLSQILPSLRLDSLDLSNNPFEYLGMLALAKTLPKTQIVNLRLASTHGCALEKLIQSLPQTKIQKLDLYDVNMIERDFSLLAWTLHDTSIRELDLGENEISDPLFCLLMGLIPYTKVGKLHISDNKIHLEDEETIKYFEIALASGRLKELDLSGNCTRDSVAFSLAKALPFSKIETLDLSCCLIEEAGIRQLASSLPSTKIKELKLRTNYVGNGGLMALSKVLPDTSIEKLDIAFDQTKFDTASLELFKEAVLQSKLKHLSFGLNDIGICGVKILAEILKKGHLNTLNLRCDRTIGFEGAVILADSLKNSSLKKLYFDSNKIGDKGCMAIAKALPHSNLESVDLRQNEITDESVQTLIEAMQHPLKHMKVEVNFFSPEAKRELIKMGKARGVSVDV